MGRKCPRCGRPRAAILARCNCGLEFKDIYVIRPGFALIVFGPLATPFLVGAWSLLGPLLHERSPLAIVNFMGVFAPGSLLAFLALRGFFGGRNDALAGLTPRFWSLAFCAAFAGAVAATFFNPLAGLGLFLTALICGAGAPRVREFMEKYPGN